MAALNLRGPAERLKMLRGSCAFFAAEVLGIEIGDHHLEWSRLIRQHARISILAARGHGKSGFWSYAYPLWQSWRTPHNRGLLVSDTEGQVGEFFRIIKDGKQFTDDTGHEWKLPAVADVPFLVEAGMLPRGWERNWTESRISFSNRSRIEGRTFGKRFRGLHVMWMVVDDPIGDDAQYSEVSREKDWNFLTRTLGGMLLPGAQQVVAGTPMHADDVHGRLGKNEEYEQRRYPAIIKGEDGRERALWPEFRPMSWLRRKAVEVGSLAFGQEFLLVPATSEASLFPMSLFTRRRETLDHELCVGLSLEEIEDRGWTVVFGVDVAQSAEIGADYFVVSVMAVDDNGNRHIIDLFREKGLQFHQQLATIEDWAARYEPALIVIEANASQRIYGDEMIRTTDLPIYKFVTTAGAKNSLDAGVPGLRTLIENGKLRLARGDAESVKVTDPLLAEFAAFSWVDGKLQGVGAHDDTVMATWLADQGVRMTRRFGVVAATADEPEDVERPGEVGADVYDEEPEPAVEGQRWATPGDQAEKTPTRPVAVPSTPAGPDDAAADGNAPRRARRAAVRNAAGALSQVFSGMPPAHLAAVADDLPDDRAVWIEAWNAMAGGGEFPGGAERARAAHGDAGLRALLRALLGV